MLAEVAADPVNLVTLSPHWVSFIITLLLPLAVALVTKVNAPPRVKAVVLLVLTALNVLITNAVIDTGQAVFSRETLVQWLMSTLIAVFMYLGVYQPIAQINARLAPNAGIGPKAPPA